MLKSSLIVNEDENILKNLNCNLKSYINYRIIDEDGRLIVTDKRILFCEIVKGDFSIVEEFKYNLITSVFVKDDPSDYYVIFKYNGDKVKLSKINSTDEKSFLDTIDIINDKKYKL